MLKIVEYNQHFKSIITNPEGITSLPEVLVPVLGKVVGIYSKINATSVNGRFYSRDFWTKVLQRQDIKDALEKGTMLGTFEHPIVKKFSDKYYTESGTPNHRHPLNSSHVTKKLWIEGDYVMGESYILNNPIGRSLATYLLATNEDGIPLVELNMSVRGYSQKDYYKADGLDHMNPNDYKLDAFDVVLNPGIKGARIKMESDSNEGWDGNDYITDSLIEKIESVNTLYESTNKIILDLVDELNIKTKLNINGRIS